MTTLSQITWSLSSVGCLWGRYGSKAAEHRDTKDQTSSLLEMFLCIGCCVVPAGSNDLDCKCVMWVLDNKVPDSWRVKAGLAVTVSDTREITTQHPTHHWLHLRSQKEKKKKKTSTHSFLVSTQSNLTTASIKLQDRAKK